MFVQSNDLFFAPGGDGIALYDKGGKAVMGDVTSQVALWDAGTELNEEPGVGPAQAPRQPRPNYGEPDPNPNVRIARDTFGNLPPVADVIRVVLVAQDGGRFDARVDGHAGHRTADHQVVPEPRGTYAAVVLIGRSVRGPGRRGRPTSDGRQRSLVAHRASGHRASPQMRAGDACDYAAPVPVASRVALGLWSDVSPV